MADESKQPQTGAEGKAAPDTEDAIAEAIARALSTPAPSPGNALEDVVANAKATMVRSYLDAVPAHPTRRVSGLSRTASGPHSPDSPALPPGQVAEVHGRHSASLQPHS